MCLLSLRDAALTTPIDDPPQSSSIWGWDLDSYYPLVMAGIAVENDHRNSEFSHEK